MARAASARALPVSCRGRLLRRMRRDDCGRAVSDTSEGLSPAPGRRRPRLRRAPTCLARRRRHGSGRTGRAPTGLPGSQPPCSRRPSPYRSPPGRADARDARPSPALHGRSPAEATAADGTAAREFFVEATAGGGVCSAQPAPPGTPRHAHRRGHRHGRDRRLRGSAAGEQRLQRAESGPRSSACSARRKRRRGFATGCSSPCASERRARKMSVSTAD